MYAKYTTYLRKIKDMKMTPQKWLILCGVLYIVYATIDANRLKPVDIQLTGYNDLTNVAQAYADKELTANLKYPDGWEYESKGMERKDSVTYNFNAFVLAKNGFGVRSRLLYNFKVQYVGSIEDSYSSDTNKLPGNWKIITSEVVQ
jgi:hypothetical protein